MRWIFWGLCSIALLLSACDALQNDDGDDGELPTRVEVATEQVVPSEEPSPTAEIMETMAPTATPRPLVRPTLPPTWTPTPVPASPTFTLTPTLTATVTREPIQPLEACNTFAVDFEQTQKNFVLGESPTIAWTPVEGAELYRLYIYYEGVQRVYYWLHDSNVYEVPAGVFTRSGRYAWEIEPLDPAGIQMCFSRGEMLVANEN